MRAAPAALGEPLHDLRHALVAKQPANRQAFLPSGLPYARLPEPVLLIITCTKQLESGDGMLGALIQRFVFR